MGKVNLQKYVLVSVSSLFFTNLIVHFCLSGSSISDLALPRTTKTSSSVEKLWEGWVGRLVKQFFMVGFS